MTQLVAGIMRFDGRAVRSDDLASMLAAMFCTTTQPQIWAKDGIGLAAADLAGSTFSERQPDLLARSCAGIIAATSDYDQPAAADWTQLINQPEIAESDAVLPLLDSHLNVLSGPFSGALWHEAAKTLFCFRDHMGASPFYYAHQAGRYLVFASTVSAILCYLRDETASTADRDRLATLLAKSPGSMESTFFAGISRLPPGHIATVNPAGLRLYRYWHPTLTPISLPSDAAYQDSFRALFNQAVKRSLPLTGQAGTLLSGGMDSSSIACIAADFSAATGRPRLKSFTNLFSEDDERPYAHAVITAKNLDPYFLEEEKTRLADDTIPLIKAIEEPFEHPGIVGAWRLSCAVETAGIATLLDGTLGDSVISYNTRFLAELLARLKFRRALREGILFTRRMHGTHASPFPMLWKDGIQPWLGQALRHGKRQDHLRQYLEATGPSNVRAMEMRTKLGFACGYLTRMPFADRDLVAFCVRLPPEQRVRDGWNRYILRAALRDTLPRVVALRGNKFSSGRAIRANFASFLKTGGDAQIAQAAHRLDAILDPGAVMAAMARVRDSPSPVPISDLIAAWTPFSICCWLDSFKVAL